MVFIFKKIFKTKIFIFLLSLIIIPQSIFAYSDKIIVGGSSVGIKLNLNGIMIEGSYEVLGHDNLKESDLSKGDIIIKINDEIVTNISDMVNIIESSNNAQVSITYLHNNDIKTTNLNIYTEDGKIKTGLYVKDTISGVGTLSYIDPETKIFGVLGHEITDKDGNIFNILDGTIFDSEITGLTRSQMGNPGEKNAILYSDKIFGNIKENTNKGIFGMYLDSLNNDNLYKVAKINDIKLGEAKILTELDDNEIKEYNINILSVDNTKDKIKNILFEITDSELLEKTNGIVQGMSGSPIIQDDYIIGAVTHVVVENPHKGYGILITNMLEEGEN